jgi:hypothetical protein
VGAHLVILEAWLAGELNGDIEELASMALDLFVAGGAWAQGIRLDELGYATGSPAAPATTKARSRRPQPASTSTAEDAAGESQ